MRLIDADVYITTMLYDDEHEEWREKRMTIAEYLDRYTDDGCPPSIYIVTCGECKHWHKKDDLTYCDRKTYGYGYKADDFCSYGERASDE